MDSATLETTPKLLTKKQKQVLDYIETYLEENGISPTFKEIQAHFKLRSLGSVYRYIHTLKTRGLITAEPNCARSLSPTQEKKSASDIPLIGKLNGDKKIAFYSKPEWITLPSALHTRYESTYAVQLDESSYEKEHLLKGDILYIETQVEPKNGDPILFCSEQGHMLIKRYFEDFPYLKLTSLADSKQANFFLSDQIDIHGIVRGIFRAI